MEFLKELEGLINKHSLENESDTPDFILAQFLKGSLYAFNHAVVARRDWHSTENTENWETKI